MKVIDALKHIYSFVRAFNFLLTNGELSGLGTKLEKPLYLTSLFQSKETSESKKSDGANAEQQTENEKKSAETSTSVHLDKDVSSSDDRKEDADKKV